MTKNALFELIKTLSKTEKGYLRKNALLGKDGGTVSYMKLFDAIDAQEAYNEEKLLRKFKGETFVKHFSKTKNYLFNVLVKRLAQYHEENESALKVKGVVNQAYVLFRKGLYDSAVELLERALRMAREEENHVLEYEIYIRFIEIYSIGKLGSEFKYAKEFEKVKKLISAAHTGMVLHNKMSQIIFDKSVSKEKNFKTKINEILNHPFMKNEDDSLGYEINFRRKSTMSHAFSHLQNHDETNKIREELLALMEHKKKVSGKEPRGYVKQLVNFISTKLNLLDFDSVPGLLEKLKNASAEDGLIAHMTPVRDCSYYILKLYYLTETGQFPAAQKVLNEALPWYTDNDKLISDYFRLAFYDVAFLVQFGNGEYKKCIPLINKICNHQSSFSKDLQLSVKFNLLLLHFELKNSDLLDYLIKPIQKEIKLYDENLKSEILIVKWFSEQVTFGKNKAELKKSILNFRSKLSELQEKDSTVSVHNLNLFSAWMDAKTKDIGFANAFAQLYVKK